MTTGAAGLDREARRALVEGTASPMLNGIDAVEVLSNFPGSPGHQPDAPQQRTLLVRLLRDPVPDRLQQNTCASPAVRASIRGSTRSVCCGHISQSIW